MASDNIVGLLTGIISGANDASKMLIEDALYRRRQKEQTQNEFDMYKMKLPLLQEQEQIKNNQELARQKELSRYDQSIKPPSIETVYDPKTLKPVFSGKPGEKFEALKTPVGQEIITQKRADELRTMGVPITSDKYKIVGTGEDKGSQLSGSTKNQIAELDNLKDRFIALQGMQTPSSGAGDFIGNKLASGVSSIPVVGGLATNAAAYNRLKGEVALQAQKAFTGSSRIIGQAIKFDVGQMPNYGDPAAVSDKQWNFAIDSIKSLRDKLANSSNISGSDSNPASDIPVNTGEQSQNIKASDLKVGSAFGGGKIKAVRWK